MKSTSMSDLVAREQRRDEIRAAIRQAFDDRPRPPDEALVDLSVGDVEEKQRIASQYVGKRWNDVVQDMATECSDLSGMTKEAFVYFLPACLEMALDDEMGDLAAHSVVNWSSPPDESAKTWTKERFRAMTHLPDGCRRVIREFLEYVDRFRGGEFPSGILKRALSAYWASQS